MIDKEIPKLINEIFEKTNFVANISIVLPQEDVKTLLDILPNYAELFKDRTISWRITDVKGDGIKLDLIHIQKYLKMKEVSDNND